MEVAMFTFSTFEYLLLIEYLLFFDIRKPFSNSPGSYPLQMWNAVND